MPRILCSLLFTLVIAIPAAADSDGYFCAGPDYLAVEFRSFNTPGLAGPHVVKILHFEYGRAPRWSGQVIVEDFQPHSMMCEAKTILIAGAGNPGRGWISYTLTFDVAGVPKIVSQTNDPLPASLPPDRLVNLGNWARAGVMPLIVGERSRHFQLRVTDISSRQGNQIRHRKRTVLEEIDEGGRIVYSMVISEGALYESID
jgi:hypothetical protein